MPSLLFHSDFFSAPFLLVFTLVAILSAAAWKDLKTFTIPHIYAYLVAGLFVVHALWAGISLSFLPWHLLSAIIAFLVGFFLFSVRLMGGGDVKLFTALALWFFPLGLVGLIFSITTTGVVLSLGIAVTRLWISPKLAPVPTTIADRYQSVRKIRIPYGPSIALGTIIYLTLSNNLGL